MWTAGAITSNDLDVTGALFCRTTTTKYIYREKHEYKYAVFPITLVTAKTILKKKTKAGRLTLPDFKTHYEGMVIKTE